MEEMHPLCSGLWFPDDKMANCVPGSWEVAHRMAVPLHTWGQLVLRSRGGTVALSAQPRPHVADGFSCWECEAAAVVPRPLS